MPSIPNALPPQAGERNRRADQGTRNTPAAGQSFDDYLNHVSAAATEATPEPRGEHKPERAEKSQKGGPAQSKNAPKTSNTQPARSDDAPDDVPEVDGNAGDGATGEPLPIPVCLAPQTPVPAERPVGDVIESKPQADAPDSSPKLKAAIEWGNTPLGQRPDKAPTEEVLPTPKEPQICTGGPGARVEKIDAPVVTAKQPIAVRPDSVASEPTDQSKPQPRPSETTPKDQPEVPGHRPEAPVKGVVLPHAEQPERHESRASQNAAAAKSEFNNEPVVRADAAPLDERPEQGKVERSAQPAARVPEQPRPVAAIKPDENAADEIKNALKDVRVIGAEEGRRGSEGALNPATELGRFILPVGPAADSTSIPAAGGGLRVERPGVTGGETSGVKPSIGAAEPAAASGGGDANMERLVKILSGSHGESNWRVALQLDPPEMGRLHIHARMEDGGLSLNVAADNEAVRRTIESRMGELRDALGEHGIRLDAADVRVRSGGEAGHGATRDHSSGGNADSAGRGFSQGQSSQGQASNRGDGGSWQAPGGSGQSYGGESRPSNSGWAGPMGLADVTATSETSVDLVA